MDLIRVMTVFGTRPEAIKLAPIIQQLDKHPRFKSIPVVTAQHREMLDQVLNLFKIKPTRDLDLMRENQSLASLTASIFTHLDPILEDFDTWMAVREIDRLPDIHLKVVCQSSKFIGCCNINVSVCIFH